VKQYLISYWNIQNLTDARAGQIADKVIPQLDKSDVTFILEGLMPTDAIVTAWLKRYKTAYARDLMGVRVDAADTTQRNECYLVFWKPETVGKTATAALQTYGLDDKQPPGRLPVVLSGTIKAAAWHAPGPSTKDNQNDVNALTHATVLAKNNVQAFGGDFNYNNQSGKIGKYVVVASAKPTTFGGNFYDYVGLLPGIKGESAGDFSPGVSDHRGISVRVILP
jgi:hypothetical protein